MSGSSLEGVPPTRGLRTKRFAKELGLSPIPANPVNLVPTGKRRGFDFTLRGEANTGPPLATTNGASGAHAPVTGGSGWLMTWVVVSTSPGSGDRDNSPTRRASSTELGPGSVGWDARVRMASSTL